MQRGEESLPCLHLATAFLYIYNGHSLPLHVRFHRSLWNNLCLLYADRLGYDPSILKLLGKNQYVNSSVGGKQVFSIKGKNSAGMAHLKDLLFHRHRETEETSLKFSNLSQEEIILWKEGRPSSHLSYELSFWNDLAKWMMMSQDGGAIYKISFDYSPKQIPNRIHISFPDFEVSFYLSEANLPLIIPSLATVDSPLKVYDSDAGAIEKVTYDKFEGCLNIILKSEYTTSKAKNKKKKEEGGHLLKNWFYFPKEGFYARDPHGLLASPKICTQDIGQALDEHFLLLKDLIEGIIIHDDVIQASYKLDFDAEWNLHVTCYAFTPGILVFPSPEILDNGSI